MIIVHYCPFDVNSNVAIMKDGTCIYENVPSNTKDFPEAIYQLTRTYKDNGVRLYGPKDIMEETINYIQDKYYNNKIQIEVIE